MTRWLVAGALVALTAGCGTQSHTPSAPHNPLADSADQVMFGAREKLNADGVNKSDVSADTGYFFDDNTRIEMRGHVSATFFTDLGAKNAVLTADQGTVNNRTGNMDSRGNVVVVTVDGRRLTSPVVRFNQQRNEISSDTSFVATDSSRRLVGIGFTSDPNMTNVHCLRQCGGLGGQVILPSSNKPAAPAPSGPPPEPPPPAPSVAPHDTVPRDSARTVKVP